MFEWVLITPLYLESNQNALSQSRSKLKETGFYMMGTSVMKDLTDSVLLIIRTHAEFTY